MYSVSFLGELAAIIWVICIIVLFMDRQHGKMAALLCFVGVFLSDQVFGHFFKSIWHRPRPFMYLDGVKVLGIQWKSSSFPSGHCDSLFAGSVILAGFYPRMALPLYAFCAITAVSRVYCGMHHPLDVLMGTLLGICTGCMVLFLYRRFLAKHDHSGHPSSAIENPRQPG